MNGTLFLILGYVVFTAYTVGIMALGIIIEKRTHIDKGVCRKLTHVISALIWVICWYFFGCSIHWIILNGLGAIALGFMTYGNLVKAYERTDADKSYGLFYFGISTFIVALICYLVGEELYLYTGITYYCLALGDGLAPIVVKLFGKKNVKISETRSLVGSFTVFIVSFLSTLIFNYAFGMELNILFIVSVAALTCVTEFYGLKGLDNIFIEFSVFGYLLLYHYGFVTTLLEITIITMPIIALLAIKTKSLTIGGGIAGLILFLLIAMFSTDYSMVIVTVLFFSIATVVAVVTGKVFSKQTGKPREKYARSGKQVLAVGTLAVALLVINYFVRHPILCALSFLALTEQFADSMASDFGRLSNGKTVNIIGFSPIEKGLSGGVSLLGTLCALLGSAALAFIPYAFGILSLKYSLLITVFAFLGTFIDSILGSTVQALYLCETCGKKTETKTHCDGQAKLVKGVSFIDNVAVNFLTGIITCGIGTLMLLF